MIPKSIKWRLQIWYGLILVLVLAGFGFTAYQLERGGCLDALMMSCIGVLEFWLMRYTVRRRVDWVETNHLLTTRHPANFPTTARRDKTLVRRLSFIYRSKPLDYSAQTIRILFISSLKVATAMNWRVRTTGRKVKWIFKPGLMHANRFPTWIIYRLPVHR